MTAQTVPIRLTRSVPGLGGEGEVRRVAFGYARNFLLPRGLATIISGAQAETLIARQRMVKASVAHERQAVIEIAAALDGRSVELSAPANSDGRLFGAIQADDVAAALDTDPIFRMEPLKQAGEHQTTLDFGHDILAHVTVVVRAEAAPRRR